MPQIIFSDEFPLEPEELGEVSIADAKKAIELANEELYLAHYGVGHLGDPPGVGSGRFAWGSGDNPGQHEKGLGKQVAFLKKQGISESEIAKGLGYKSSTDLRAAIMMEKERKKGLLAVNIPKLKEQGLKNTEIAEKLGVSEGTVRNYLDANKQVQVDKTRRVADAIKEELKEKRYIDVGSGVNLEIENGISEERLKTALAMLEAEGYKQHSVKVEQMGNPGQYTTVKVIGTPDTEWREVVKDPTLIKTMQSYAVEDGTTVLGIKPVKSIDSSRVFINYTDENGKGGAERDGEIQLRRGVEDISLGNNMYAQVRIAVDGTHYMKGMAVYSDNIPDGYDIIYNTNKKVGTDKYKVFKEMEKDKDGNINQENPFGATIKAGGQSYCLDKNGNETDNLRVINKINEQGDWGEWSKQISSQVLAKQPLPLVKKQLDLTYQDKVKEYEEICSLTNPTLKKKMLESFADDCDASAVHLKAKAFAGQATHAIIPIPSLKDDEVYAPNYEHGESLALIRYPHAGKFEIPIVKVNNHNGEALSTMKNAPDAVGINSHVAERLSGADFDGDTVVCIPLKSANIQNAPQLKALKNFDSKQYKIADSDIKRDKSGKITDSRIMSPELKQREMGQITNLIADMTIKGANENELARAVKHSMVVIDAVKHNLDYKQSAADNRIDQLKQSYQDGGGATTLLTRAKNETRIKARKLTSVVDTETGKSVYGIDPVTGKKAYVETGETYTKKSPTKKDPDRTITVERLEKVPRMSVTDDARDLMSSKSNPHPVELAYANYANQCKELANTARKTMINTQKLQRDPQAAREYSEEVKSLKEKVIRAEKNAPRERQAQILAKAIYNSQLESNPDIKTDKDHLKRLKGQALSSARNKVGAKKERVDITDKEWTAIQSRAISDSMLKKIFDNTDSDALKKRATPKAGSVLTDTEIAIIKNMAARDNVTLKDIANRLDISTSTVSNVLKGV